MSLLPNSISGSQDKFVFISYSHEDADALKATVSHLKAIGIKVWMDDGIHPGENWQSEIAEAIDSSSLFLIFVSPRSATSAVCNRELNFAVAHEKPLLAVHIEETVSSAWELALNDRQAILKYKLDDDKYLNAVTEAVTRLMTTSKLTQPLLATKRKARSSIYPLLAVAALGVYIASQWFGVGKPAGDAFAPLSNSVAVLPFANLSGEPEDYFTAGMTEEILNALANIEGLRVIARTSSFRAGRNMSDIPEVGRRLNVSKVLTGSVRRIANDLRISVQLIDTDDGEHVWSKSYDRQLDRVLELQKDISESVAEMMEVTVDELQGEQKENQAVSMEAFDHYLLGRFHLNDRSIESIDKAADHFRLAIDADPTFVSSYSGLADSYFLLMSYGNLSATETTGLMEAVIKDARELDPENPDVLTSSGALNRLRGAVDQAERDYRAALVANPNSAQTHMWLGNLLVNENRIIEAREAYANASTLDPLNTAVLVNLGRVNLFQGRADEGFEFLRRAGDADPGSQLVFAQQAYWMSHYGMLVDSTSAALKSLSIDPNGTSNTAAVLETYLHLGAMEEARYVLDHAIRTGSDSWRIIWVRYDYHYYNGEIDALDAYLQGRLRALTDESTIDRKVVLALAGSAKMAKGEYRTAIRYLQEGLVNNSVIDATALVYFRGLEALGHQRVGEIEEFQRVIDQVNADIDESLAEGWRMPEFLVRVGEIRALEGRTGDAMEFLNEAISLGFKRYLVLERSPLLSSIREHPEFVQHLKSLQANASTARSTIREGLEFDDDIVQIIH